MPLVDSIIEDLGGPVRVARLLGVTAQAVSNMRRRGSIGSEYWERLVAAAKDARVDGVTLEALARDAARRRAVGVGRIS